MTGEAGAPAVVTDARSEHLTAVQAAYAHYVLTSVATFDLAPPPLAAWEARLHSGAEVDEFLVAVRSGEVVGFAYSSAYRPKEAYASTRETSVYTVAGSDGRGLGGLLYAELLRRLDARPEVLLLVANIAEPNPASSALHRRFGYRPVGTLTGVGVKFGEARDVTLWQRRSEPGPG